MGILGSPPSGHREKDGGCPRLLAGKKKVGVHNYSTIGQDAPRKRRWVSTIHWNRCHGRAGKSLFQMSILL